MRISDWSSDVCSSDLLRPRDRLAGDERRLGEGRIEPVDDREALDERRAVDLERRHESLRVARQIVLAVLRSEEHTSELQSLMRLSYAVFSLKTIIEAAAASGHSVTIDYPRRLH